MVRQAIERVRPWMSKYVQSQLDWSVSENDFTDRIVQRVSAAHEREPFLGLAAPAQADEAVKESLRFLVYEEKRSAYRKPLIPLEGICQNWFRRNGVRLISKGKPGVSEQQVVSRGPGTLIARHPPSYETVPFF